MSDKARIVKRGNAYAVFGPDRALPIMCVDGDDASNVARLWDANERLRAELAEARLLLGQCQWGDGSVCPMCGQHIHENDRGKIVGHMGACELAKFLRRHSG